MFKSILITILVPTLILHTNGDTNTTDTNIFVKFNHAEANYEPPTTKPPETTTTETTTTTTTELPPLEDAPDTIVFVPNDRPVQNEDYSDSNLRIKDIMMMKAADDSFDKTFHLETESPSENNIMFISGKNTEFVEEPVRKKKTEDGTRRSGKETPIAEKIDKFKLDCLNIDCNNTIRSLCGGKIEHNMWRYRLFLNECYYRKVNCNFKYEVNRYKKMPKEKCSNMGVHEAPFSFKPKPFNIQKSVKTDSIARRSSSSRRSLTMDSNGKFCSHPCPISCPDDYDPQCAVSGTGQRRVFVNHCKLDFNSCSYGVVWHSRPLAECVGGIKADMRQNRSFIGWMQKIISPD